MRDYKTLREVVERIKDKAALHLMEYEPGNEHDWMFVRDVLGKALGDTSETSEMERLREWLEQKRATPANTPADRGWESAFTVILHHIKSGFGGEDATH